MRRMGLLQTDTDLTHGSIRLRLTATLEERWRAGTGIAGTALIEDGMVYTAVVLENGRHADTARG